MAFQFPASPILGQTFTPIPGTTYKWNGTGWAPVSPGYIATAEKGAANGVATLDGTTKVPVAQLPVIPLANLPAGVANGLATLDAGAFVPQAQLDTTRVWTKPQRVTPLVDNDGSFDMNAAQDFRCTTAGATAITFTNITAGQRGMILLTNAANHAITFGAAVKKGTTAAADLSVTGAYQLSYWSPDGANVYLTYSEALS